MRIFLALFTLAAALSAQSIGSGTVSGAITDPSNAVVRGAQVTLANPISGYSQTATTGDNGQFRFSNVPENHYELNVSSAGFAPASRHVEVRSSVPIVVNVTLKVGAESTSISVQATTIEPEADPSAHVDIDRNLVLKLPEADPGAGLSDTITHTTGGVAADANGFFHPLGDHAEASFVIDGQPISDQQSKVFSTQLPASAVQSMELTTGTPDAEFGDKTSLVAQITTRSGLGQNGLHGSVDANYGSFGNAGGSVGLSAGSAKFGNYLALDGVRSGRFLDTPEFRPYHDVGNNQTIFDRADYQPDASDVFHLNLFAARNWIQIPNSLDQLGQDQRQRVLTWSVAPGYQRTIGAKALLTVNPYIRKDQFNYYGSRDPFADTPATQAQNRQLLNWGLKSDLSITSGRHNVKFGIDLKQTRLLENFGFGLTDPTFNSPCIDSDGAPAGDISLTSLSQCAAAGYLPNADGFSAALLPFDLSRGGAPFQFHGAANINQYAFYLQDRIALGNLTVNAGFRFDRYDGLTHNTGAEPRLGLAYNVKRTSTVLRASYARTFETPFNENLLLSSATGAGGLAQNIFGSTSVAIQPGFRNQFNTGFQQGIGKFILVDGDYFWKFTHNAYDFSALLNTTITFPIAWHNSKLDGVTGRVSTTTIHGFQASWTAGHTRARFFFPEEGGLIPQGTPLNGSVFRIDHDQAFQATFTAHYQRPKNAEWIAFTHRYDSGLVVIGVPDAGAALALDGNQQATIGLACNGVFATPASHLTNCANADGSLGRVTSRLIVLPQGGYGNFSSQENDDHNPARVKPRNVFDLGIGTDNLLHSEGPRRITASLQIVNITGVRALYNFLSTFSGTHFLQPRTLIAKIGYTF
ncbi:MAG TPA: TonB-dependent receptor [Bryobacteraceae bacterium]|nr:TonB-dependent receptor [Bryobacteraceae bacterium]